MPECRRLLAIGAAEGFHGHLGVAADGAPLVLPVNYAMHGADVVLRVGEGAFGQLAAHPLASFQVDGADGAQLWSVLVRGLTTEEDAESLGGHVPRPFVAEWGHRIVRLRADVVTGRRFVPRPVGPLAPSS